MPSLKTFLFGAAASVAFMGCGLGGSGKAVTMADAFDIDIFGPHTDDLHSPYVAGASFNITVNTQNDDAQSGWVFSSSDGNVIEATSALVGGTVTITAKHPGQTTLSVLDSTGKVLDSHVVTVAIPDQVSLYAEGLLLTGATDDVAQVTQASVVEGGEATFLVRYFLQGTELYGNGALQPMGTNGVVATTTTASFAEARDFLQVSPPEMGKSGSVSLSVGNVVVAEVPITTVKNSAITHVTIIPQSSDGAQKGQSLSLYAHAVDESSSEVYGASFNWLINGVAQVAYEGGPADLFLYNFDGTVTETVAATFEGFDPSTVVHGQGGSVGSTSDVGCSLSGAPGTAATGDGLAAATGLMIAMAGVLATRRRAAFRSFRSNV
jgi:hypothetical protein